MASGKMKILKSKVKAGLLLVLALFLVIYVFQGDGYLVEAARKIGKGKPSPTPTSTPAPLPVPASGELITNGSFEDGYDKNSVPDGWAHHYDQPNKNSKTDCNIANTGSCSFYIPGKKHTALKQYIPVNVDAGKKITISGWSKADNARYDQGPSTGSYWVQAWIHYADGSTQFNFHSDFNMGTHGFEKVEKSMILPQATEGFTVFAKQAMDGNVWFDDISLVVE